MLKAILITAASAGLGTSLIEYLVGYNAIDWIKDKLTAVYAYIKFKVLGWLSTL